MSTPTPTRTRWLIIGLLYCTYVLMFIDRINISIAAKYIMPEYGLSDVSSAGFSAPLCWAMPCPRSRAAGWATASAPGA